MLGLLPQGGSVAARARTQIGPRGHEDSYADGHANGHADDDADGHEARRLTTCAAGVNCGPPWSTEPGWDGTGTETRSVPGQGRITQLHLKALFIEKRLHFSWDHSF